MGGGRNVNKYESPLGFECGVWRKALQRKALDIFDYRGQKHQY